MLGLIELRGVEADGEALDRFGRQRLHDRRHQRGIDPAGEEDAERHVGDHLAVDDFAQGPIERLHRRPGVAQPVVMAGAHDVGEAPIGSYRRRRALAPGEQSARIELANAGVDRQGRGDVAVAEVGREGGWVEILRQIADLFEGPQLRGECQTPAACAVVERLFAHPVAGEAGGVGAAIPDAQGEHALGPGQGPLHAQPGNGFEENLGVRQAAPGDRPPPSSSARSRRIVVDLAVHGQDVSAAGRFHRLMAGLGDVDDRQPPLAEPGAVAFPHPLVVRAAVTEGIQHPPDRPPRDLGRAADQSRYAAHGATFSGSAGPISGGP